MLPSLRANVCSRQINFSPDNINNNQIVYILSGEGSEYLCIRGNLFWFCMYHLTSSCVLFVSISIRLSVCVSLLWVKLHIFPLPVMCDCLMAAHQRARLWCCREKNTPEGRKWIKRKNNYNNVREGRQIKILRKILKFKYYIKCTCLLLIQSDQKYFPMCCISLLMWSKSSLCMKKKELVAVALYWSVKSNIRLGYDIYTLPNHQKVCHYAMSQKYLESKFNQGLSWCLKAVRHADGAKSFQTKDTSF